MADHFEKNHLISIVKNATCFEVPRTLGGNAGYLDVPQIRDHVEPLMTAKVKGRCGNMPEVILLFIRDEVADPAVGKHNTKMFIPFLGAIFFFVLACKLLGMVPRWGSPTGALVTTGILAFTTFLVVRGVGICKMGSIGSWVGQVPHRDLPFPLGYLLQFGSFLIERARLLIKRFVLPGRLLVNMIAGYLVLAVIIAFIVVAWNSWAVYGVSPTSNLGATALSVLELFAAFLSACIFTFGAVLFIGMAIHPQQKHYILTGRI